MSVFDNLTTPTLFFSMIRSVPMVRENGKRLGKVLDLFVNYEEMYPMVLGFLYTYKRQYYYVEWSDVLSFSLEKIVIKKDVKIRQGKTFPKVAHEKVLTSLLASQFSEATVDYPSIAKVILDHQIVDTYGKKVVRVNDIHLMKIGSFLRVTHAAVGVRSMIRRLGFEKPIDRLVHWVNPTSKYLSLDVLINWKFVLAIPDKSVHKNVKLSVANEEMEMIHPADLADIMEDLDPHAREVLFDNLDPEIQAQTLPELEQDVQNTLIKETDPEDLAKILENMETDKAADILAELDEGQAEEVIANIADSEVKEDIQELLDYKEDTAGGLMTTNILQVTPDKTKKEILQLIKEYQEQADSIYDVFIVDEQHTLLGTCSLKDLLFSEENTAIKDYMNDHDIKSLLPETTWKETASYMSKYNLINVPVVNEQNTLLGCISVDNILPWLLDQK